MVDVILAGYNVDVGQLKKLKNGEDVITTPETLSAAYARISRDPKSVTDLRAESILDVEKARKSNENIVFGMGHASVAEHSVFNFDVTGASRRLIEDIEKLRLTSFTEKSQRYVTLDGDIVIPNEIRNTPLESIYLEIIEEQNNFYHNNLEKLIEYHGKKPQNSLQKKKTIEGFGKEDARYGVSLATEGQLGMTINARSLENFIRYLKGVGYEEATNFATQLLNETKHIIPSLLKYTSGTDYDIKTRPELREFVSGLLSVNNFPDNPVSLSSNVHVRSFFPSKTSLAQAAGLIFSSSKISYTLALHVAEKMMNDKSRANLIHNIAHAHQEDYDPKLREIELESKLFFELELSASAFAQLKRHRIATLIKQQYHTGFYHTVPESILNTGLAQNLKDVVGLSSSGYDKLILEGLPIPVAEMLLTNAHKRRVLFSADPRELFALARLRLDEHAQWDIKNVIVEMSRQLYEHDPVAYISLCGKDEFHKNKEEIKLKYS